MNLENAYQSDAFMKPGEARTSDIVIPIMGPAGAGKSTFINVATGGPVAEVGNSWRELQSCTSLLQHYIVHHPKDNSRRIILVDTPDFGETSIDGTDMLTRIAVWLARSYNDDMKLAGIIYLQDISQPRWAMPIDMSEYFTMFEKLSGQLAAEHIVFATTKWADVTDAAGERRERDLSDLYWKAMLDQGSHLRRFQNTHTSAWEIIDLILKETEDNTPQIRKELVDLLPEMSNERSPKQIEDDQLYDTSKENAGADTGEVEEAVTTEERGKVEEKPEKNEGEGATQLMASTSEPQSDPMMTALSADRSEGETKIPRSDIVKDKAAEQRKAEEMHTLARKDCADDSIFPAGDLPTANRNKRNKGENSRSRRRPRASAYADRSEIYVDPPRGNDHENDRCCRCIIH